MEHGDEIYPGDGIGIITVYAAHNRALKGMFSLSENYFKDTQVDEHNNSALT